jgi:hypothetical protein
MKRAVPTLCFSIRKPRSSRRGFRLFVDASYRRIRLACGPRGSDETIFLARRKRPETEGKIPMIVQIKGAMMLMSVLNLIYREFLKSAVPGMVSMGGRRQ